MLRELLACSPEGLRVEAVRLARPKSAEGHWTDLAVILGRADDERLWAWYANTDGVLYGSCREWATEELGMPGDDVVTALKLWRLLRTAEAAGVPLETWTSMPKTRAVLLRRVVDAHGDIRRWLEISAAYPRTEDFDKVVRARLGQKEVWTTRTLALPDSVDQLWNAALVLAATEVTGNPEIDPARVYDRDLLHQLVDRVAGVYVAARAMVAGRVPATEEDEP